MRSSFDVGIMLAYLSSSHPDINYTELDWSASLEPERLPTMTSLVNEKINPDIILGADVVYDPSLVPALVGTLKVLLEPKGVPDRRSALFAIAVRNESTLARFLALARESFLVEVVEAGFEETSFNETVKGREACEKVILFRITWPQHHT
ncbi:hypothetical protein B0H34DRAFT_19036 [Crassisporium funariophilum]|nr:hypothetical protein B0H34DRAFT_19036 [Crassisporium funariophilum]